MIVYSINLYLLSWSNFEEDVGYSYCLDKCNHEADVIPNAQEYSCYLNDNNTCLKGVACM